MIWDLPTRLFHWGLVVLIVIAWRSAETGDMQTHLLAGAAVAGLLVFRLCWGFVGGSTARFAQFVKGPRAVLAYLTRMSAPSFGHNPAGGWSVLALLGCLLGLVGFGLFAVDTDGLNSGPLSDWVDYDAGRAASHWHGFAFTLLEGLVVLHLLAVLFYQLIKRHGLIEAMITGRRKRPGDPSDLLRPGSRRALVASLVVATAVALLLARLGG